MLELNHKKMQAWRLGMEIVHEIYRLSQDFPPHELFGLTSQIRRASISIPSNIAEGASRTTPTERSRFYQIARSSLAELDTQILIAQKLDYISANECKELAQMANSCFALLSKMIRNPH